MFRLGSPASKELPRVVAVFRSHTALKTSEFPDLIEQTDAVPLMSAGHHHEFDLTLYIHDILKSAESFKSQTELNTIKVAIMLRSEHLTLDQEIRQARRGPKSSRH